MIPVAPVFLKNKPASAVGTPDRLFRRSSPRRFFSSLNGELPLFLGWILSVAFSPSEGPLLDFQCSYVPSPSRCLDLVFRKPPPFVGCAYEHFISPLNRFASGLALFFSIFSIKRLSAIFRPPGYFRLNFFERRVLFFLGRPPLFSGGIP